MNRIAVSNINSILFAAKQDDDTKAILERMITNPGIEVVNDGDPTAENVDVVFMYPNGARKSMMSQKTEGALGGTPFIGSLPTTLLEDKPEAITAAVSMPETLVYPATFAAAEGGGVVVTFRDVPEAITQGDFFADAVEMATDALSTALEFYVEKNQAIPMPSQFKSGEVAIELSVEDTQTVFVHNFKLS